MKTQKPIEIEASLKYICPDCSLSHWIFLREAKTKGYRIVCDCNTIFRPKQISDIKVLYEKKQSMKDKISTDVLSQCCKILMDHGFSKTESVELLNKAYEQTKTNNITDLVKTALKLFGELNVKL